MFRLAASRLSRPTLAASAALAALAATHQLHHRHTSSAPLNRPPPTPAFTPVVSAESAPPASASAPSAARAGLHVPGLRTVNASEVRLRNGRGDQPRIWVGYGRGVYDVTEFVSAHPGGDYILQAAGGPLEPFWRLYAQHNADWVLEILEEMRVANLEPDEQWTRQVAKGQEGGADDAYAHEPMRHPRLIVQGHMPFNAEPQARVLVQSHFTPNDLFYVRNHMPVPVIEAGEYRLEVVDVDGDSLVTLSLEELKTQFKRHVVAATVQCAGNRRNELNEVKKVRGGSWELGAISNAEWAGARLSDVIKYAQEKGGKVKAQRKAGHVCFEGLDKDAGSGTVYAASIPMDVVERVPDVLLAYEMNGEVLPRDHGYPVRAVVPGVVGARCVKWLGKVVLSEDESTSHWQRQDYRSFSPDTDWDSVDFSKAPSIQEMPVVSTICAHDVDEEKGTISVSGYAWSGDGKGIIRVDVSGDGGRTWQGAVLREKGERMRNQDYDWTLWDAELEMPKEGEKMELVCKAIDSSYNTQPERVESIWNLRGLLNNAWHRVKVNAE